MKLLNDCPRLSATFTITGVAKPNGRQAVVESILACKHEFFEHVAKNKEGQWRHSKSSWHLWRLALAKRVAVLVIGAKTGSALVFGETVAGSQGDNKCDGCHQLS